MVVHHALYPCDCHRPLGLTNDDWEDAARVKASGGDVEIQFAYGDSQTPDPEVAEAEDPSSVGYCECEVCVMNLYLYPLIFCFRNLI